MTQIVKFNFIARVTLDNVRRAPLPFDVFGCPIKVGRLFFDGRLYSYKSPFSPGDTQLTYVKLLNWDHAKEFFVKGAAFGLWEGKIIGHGTVEELLTE